MMFIISGQKMQKVRNKKRKGKKGKGKKRA